MEIKEIKKIIAETIGAAEKSLSNLDENTPLLKGKLPIDEIDIIKIRITLERKSGVVFPKNEADSKKVFNSVSSIKKYIKENVADMNDKQTVFKKTKMLLFEN